MSRGAVNIRAFILFIVLLALALVTAGPSRVMAADTTHGEPTIEETTAVSEGVVHGQEDVHAEATHGEGEHGGGHGVSEKKFMDFVWRALNFAVLFTILFVLLRKPIAGFFGGRREEIKQTLDDFEKKQAEAEARFKELEGRLADLTDEREKILNEYIQEGEEEKQKIIAHANEMAERIKSQAQVTIQQEIKAAKTELVQEIANMSANMAEDLIKKNINDSDQERLVEEYLGKVVQN